MKVRTPTVVALLVAVAALVAPASPAQASPTDAAFNSTTGALNVNYAGYLSKHDIVYNRLNTNPLHGLTVGNGPSIWLCGGLFAAGIAVLGFFRHGRAVYAVGGNVDAARAAGIRTDRVVWVVFMVGGLLAALAGLLMTGRLGSVASAQGEGMIFTVFAAAVIGGVSMEGGKGTLFGALCGVIVLGLINNILTLAGVSVQWIQAIYGLIILVALMLARLTTGKAQD
jgi:simple sugar transport system permease protein/ribose transport system permease protein